MLSSIRLALAPIYEGLPVFLLYRLVAKGWYRSKVFILRLYLSLRSFRRKRARGICISLYTAVPGALLWKGKARRPTRRVRALILFRRPSYPDVTLGRPREVLPRGPYVRRSQGTGCTLYSVPAPRQWIWRFGRLSY